MTTLLMLLGIFMNNPFHFMFVRSSIPFLMVVESILGSVFDIFLKYFSLVLFDSLRFKNRKIGEYFYTPKLIFFMFFFVANCEECLTTFGRFQRIGATSVSWFETAIMSARAVFEGAFVGWLALSMFRSSREMDVTESYKFSLYSVLCLATIVTLFLNELVDQFFTFSERSALCFVARITAQNLFILLMALFHWPYELMSDQYLEADEFARETGLIESD
jgi:hypothetical protein